MTDAPAKQDGWTLAVELRSPDLTYQWFSEICFVLGTLHSEVRFAMGDALLIGEAVFGEECWQALELLNLSEDAQREYRRVSREIPPSMRRKRLTWSHHRAVVALRKELPDGTTAPDREAQRAWLRRADEEDLSHHQLRDALRNGLEPANRVCRCCHRAF